MDLGTRNEFKVWDETIANAQNVELLHSPDEGCGGTTENLGTRCLVAVMHSQTE